MLFFFTTAAMLLLGYEISYRLPWRAALAPLERAAASITVGFAFWIASLWALAITTSLNATFLVSRTILAAFVAVALSWSRWRRQGPREQVALPHVILLAAIPLAIWLAFVLWRGAVIPPLSHDALSHHLPKAVFYVRAQSYDPLPQFAARARGVPVNYEMLLADVIATDGNDQLTEWPSAVFYLMFIVAAGALVQRWWGAHAVADTTLVLLLAAVPVALLHSGAIKNDLMAAAFMTLALVWLGRYFETGETASLCLLAASLVMATGTKPQAAMLAIGSAPFVIQRIIQERPALRRLLGVVLFATACVAFLGGAYFFLDRLAPPSPVRGPAGGLAYGDWINFIYVPWVLVAGPFSTSVRELWVPWAADPWFWPRYEIYFSELGIPWAICAVLLPVGVVMFRRSGTTEKERLAVSLAALFAFAAMMPVRFMPLGMYAISTPRYVLFVVPVVFAWTVAPFLRLRAPRGVLRASVLIAVVVFAAYAVLNAARDVFAPIHYVVWAARHPGTRLIPFAPDRPASLVDRIASPSDSVAVELADAAWIHPLFGRNLTRPLQLIADGDPHPVVGPEIRWVVFDRTFAADWKHPAFLELGQAKTFLSRGEGALDRDPLFLLMRSRPDFRLIYYDGRTGQAIFRRRKLP